MKEGVCVQKKEARKAMRKVMLYAATLPKKKKFTNYCLKNNVQLLKNESFL